MLEHPAAWQPSEVGYIMSIQLPEPINKKPTGRREWSEEEEAIMAGYYMEIGIQEMCRLLPHRSRSAIRRHASDMGIACGGFPDWTEEEDEIIREYYRALNNPDLAELLPRRTVNAVRGRVERLGLNRMWSEEEDRILQDNYLKADFDELGDMLSGRTKGAIIRRASVLGCAGKAPGAGPLLTVETRAIREIASYIQHGAKQRGYKFNLTDEQVGELIVQPCHYCGLEAIDSNQRTIGNRGVFHYNGIDRVNNDKGYVTGNVVPCCLICNRAKNSWSAEEFKAWVKRAYHHMFGGE